MPFPLELILFKRFCFIGNWQNQLDRLETRRNGGGASPGTRPSSTFAHIADNSQEFDMVSSILGDAEVVELGVLPPTDAQAHLTRWVRTVRDRAHRLCIDLRRDLAALETQ